MLQEWAEPMPTGLGRSNCLAIAARGSIWVAGSATPGRLRAGSASETLQPVQGGVSVQITNDFPKSDGIHLFSTPTHSCQAFEFELFNPGGNLFDSTDIDGVNRTFGPELFEKIAWDIQDGNRSMTIDLQSVTLKDVALSVSSRR